MDAVIKQIAVLEYFRKAPQKGLDTSGFWGVDYWEITGVRNSETVNILVSLSNSDSTAVMTAELNVKTMCINFWKIKGDN